MSSQPQYQCLHCDSTSINPRRNLAVFIDGTSEKPGSKETSIKKLYDAILKDGSVEQHANYFKGIGAYDVVDLPLSSLVSKGISSVLEMAFAWNVADNVKNAYRWLAETYRQGDRIYLFGFSRGGYQVRALAGMIHEVGLVNEITNEGIDDAYRHYLAISRDDPTTREAAVEFKEKFSFRTLPVRVHFVGVWDTVSSLGFAMQYVHVTASASVTNSCHFRHALSLDERRVKFMPEYFLEMNVHHDDEIESPRKEVGDVKEVWFAGCHSDVGGTSRWDSDGTPRVVHAGNIPLLWMMREATDQGLHFESGKFPWGPEDVDLGRVDSMSWLWRIFEAVRIRHQVSFSGAGKYGKKMHWARPRLVIPAQQIHPSAFPGDIYVPRATLACGVEISRVPHVTPHGPGPAEPQMAGLAGIEAAKCSLNALLSDQERTRQSLGEVLSLLNLCLVNGQTLVSALGCAESSLQSDLDQFAFTMICSIKPTVSTEQMDDAKTYLVNTLGSTDNEGFPRAVYLLHFSAKHEQLRGHFLAYPGVINALTGAMDQLTDRHVNCVRNCRNKELFPLIVDSLRYLLDEESQRAFIVNRLAAEIRAGQTRLSMTLEVKAPSHLRASLEMIASLAQYHDHIDLCRTLTSKIRNLAKRGNCLVGPAAVEVLVALDELEEPPPNSRLPHCLMTIVGRTHDIPIGNILGFLDKKLSRLDAETGGAPSPPVTDLYPMLRETNDGASTLDEKLMDKLLLATESKDAVQRTLATLTMLKLCSNPIIRDFCKDRVLGIIVKQMKSEKTSLLAAYALMSCLRCNMWSGDHDLGAAAAAVAQPIVDMVDKGWFDDAVGRVEGSKIFGGLMETAEVKQCVEGLHIFEVLTTKLDNGDCDEARMSLIFLKILEVCDPASFQLTVTRSLKLLEHQNIMMQKRGVKILSSLALIKAGEQAIQPHLTKIVQMLLPPADGSRPLRYKLFGPAATLYNLCKNETLHRQLQKFPEYETFKAERLNPALYPQTQTTTCPIRCDSRRWCAVAPGLTRE